MTNIEMLPVTSTTVRLVTAAIGTCDEERVCVDVCAVGIERTGGNETGARAGDVCCGRDGVHFVGPECGHSGFHTAVYCDGAGYDGDVESVRRQLEVLGVLGAARRPARGGRRGSVGCGRSDGSKTRNGGHTFAAA